jgi:hypothetical protein
MYKTMYTDVPTGESAFLHRLAVRRIAAGTGLAGQVLEYAKKRPGNPGGNFYVWIAPSDRNCVPFMSVTGLAETAIVAPVPIASPDMGAMWNFFESE